MVILSDVSKKPAIWISKGLEKPCLHEAIAKVTLLENGFKCFLFDVNTKRLV